MSYPNIREEELKIRVGDDYFSSFDKAKIIGNVDFCVSVKTTNQTKALIEDTESQSFLWAEAKKGKSNIYHSLVQLVLTIGKARTFDKELPPPYLGAFDAYQIAFVPYSQIQEIFYQNDFNWTVTPSNYETKEFKQIHKKVEEVLHLQSLIFNFETDSKELKDFIKSNFVLGLKQTNQIQVDKNNFISIYNKWLQKVKPSLIVNWELAKKANIIDGDFYLADLLSKENQSLKESLYVLLKGDHYELDKKIDETGMFSSKRTNFNDNQTAHTQFWNRYKRPPKKEYWDYLVERRDLLVPQDVRERKGSFFTPQIWVEKSQEYLTSVLGENWQDEYYIWDCAAGTGNLLTGLTNKYNIYASTLDRADVDVMHERINNMNENSVDGKGSNLLHDHVFQFDFLNDSFEDPKVPESLQKILKDAEKRKKLVIYINPPYAEASNRDTVVGKGENKSEVATQTKTYQEFQDTTGTAARELFAQFFLRVYKDIPDSKLASFSTLKHINSQNFLKFRQYFKAEFKKGFIVPADTFDNVKGKFPIGFLIWYLGKKESIKNIKVDIFDYGENFLQTKLFSSCEKGRFVIDWLRKHYDKKNERIAYLRMQGTDMQNNRGCFFTDSPSKNDVVKHLTANITKANLIPMAIYLSVRHVFEATWLNDRDQFLYPNDGWKSDTEFQNDCLTFALFHGQNKIGSGQGVNNWIPFTENEVDSREKFESNFMVEFMRGKVEAGFIRHQNGSINASPTDELFEQTNFIPTKPLQFSPEAQEVFDAGRELWRYYHKNPKIKDFDPLTKGDGRGNYDPNASLYDIREYFQGRNETGKMNNKSTDEEYSKLIANLRDKLKRLAVKIQHKVYEYGFLRG